MKERDFIKCCSIRKSIVSLKDMNPNNRNFKTIISCLSFLQKKDGSFDLMDRNHICNDMVIDFCDEISYICTSLYIKAYLYDKKWFNRAIGFNKLEKALYNSSKYNLYGYSYDGLYFQVSMIKMFLNNGLSEFIKLYPKINYKFTNMINDIITAYKNNIINNNYSFSIKDEIKEVIDIYEN